MCVGGALRRKARGPGFDQEACLKSLRRYRSFSRLPPKCILYDPGQHIPVAIRKDHRSFTLLDHDKTVRLEKFEGIPDNGFAHPEAVDQLGLGREIVARLKASGNNLSSEVLHHLVAQAGTTPELVKGGRVVAKGPFQAGEPRQTGLTRPLGQTTIPSSEQLSI